MEDSGPLYYRVSPDSGAITKRRWNMDAGQPQNNCPSQLVRAEPRPAPTSLGNQTLPYISSYDPNICQHFRDREQHEPFNPRKNWSHPRTVMAMGLLLVVLKGPTLSTKHKYFGWKSHKHPRKSSFYFPKCHCKSQRMIEFWCVKSAKMNFKESRRSSITSHWTQGRLPMLVSFSRSVWKKKKKKTIFLDVFFMVAYNKKYFYSSQAHGYIGICWSKLGSVGHGWKPQINSGAQAGGACFSYGDWRSTKAQVQPYKYIISFCLCHIC